MGLRDTAWKEQFWDEPPDASPLRSTVPATPIPCSWAAGVSASCSVQVSVCTPSSTIPTPSWPARSRACCWRSTTQSCCSCWSPPSPSTPRWSGAWAAGRPARAGGELTADTSPRGATRLWLGQFTFSLNFQLILAESLGGEGGLKGLPFQPLQINPL